MDEQSPVASPTPVFPASADQAQILSATQVFTGTISADGQYFFPINHYGNDVRNAEEAAAFVGCELPEPYPSFVGCPVQKRKYDLLPHLEGLERVGGDILNFGPRYGGGTRPHAAAVELLRLARAHTAAAAAC